MGYTHYYTYSIRDPAFRSTWPLMVADAARIVDRVRAGGIVLSAPAGRPPVSPEGIMFTGGIADELHGEGILIRPDVHGLPPWRHDEHGVVRMSCKTERFPYDVAVAAILLRCHLLAPEAFLIDSDGDWEQEWAEDMTSPPTGGLSARGLVTELFGDSPAAEPFTDTRTGLGGTR